jgi:hypothetical protein
MSQVNSQDVAAFGKVIFVPKRESVPPLPEMSLLFFNEEKAVSPWRAACIDLEMDACGNSMDEAWENLKATLTMYIDMEKKAAGNSITGAAKNIIKAAFAESEQKRQYIDIYRNAKFQYTMQNIESGKTPDPIEEEKRRIKKLEKDHESIRSFITEMVAA